MSRPALDYANPPRVDRTFAGHDADQPVAGHYRMRLRAGGVFVGVRVWHGAPLDPETGEVLDRSHRWQALANGRPIDVERVWPACARDPIDAKEYAFLAAQQRWGEEHAPEGPQADPTRRIDMMTAPIPF